MLKQLLIAFEMSHLEFCYVAWSSGPIKDTELIKRVEKNSNEIDS